MIDVVETDKPDADETDDAQRVLLLHRPNPDRTCAGCLEFAGKLSWYPCEQARWAQQVTNGRTENSQP